MTARICVPTETTRAPIRRSCARTRRICARTWPSASITVRNAPSAPNITATIKTATGPRLASSQNSGRSRTHSSEIHMVTARFLARLLAVVAMFGAALHAWAEDPSSSIGRTPPRISLIEGEVSFWRPGAEDWAPAQVNTPLAPGDDLYTGHGGNLELQ